MAKTSDAASPRFRRALPLIALIAAGEAAFLLPFVIARIFRPTLLEVFDLTNLQLGSAFSVYGLVAMVAYFVGGPIADRFSPRNLLTIALIATAAGGFYMATRPSFAALVVLYGFWGVTTILLFWAPLIRATREWGGSESSGTAFGLLDGGRGVLAAATGSLIVGIFALLLPGDLNRSTFEERAAALQWVFIVVALITLSVSFLAWWALPWRTRAEPARLPQFALTGVRRVVRMPAVALQSFIIVCAYVGFKATDDFSLYAHVVLGLDQIESARAGTVSLWMRPIGAIVAGLLADRWSTSGMTLLSFALLVAASLVLASGWLHPGTAPLFFFALISASLGIFALRGLYYAIMEEGRVPLAFTGSAVGIVSVIGYTPDIFMGPLMGHLLDASPGPAGHHHVFFVVAAFAAAGLAATLLFRAHVARQQD